MSEPTTPMPDWTPEQKKAICAEMKKRFTVEDLLGYINDEDEKFPAEQVLEELDAMIRDYEAQRKESGR